MNALNSITSAGRPRAISRTEEVYRVVKDDIIRARYQPGDLLVEAELATRFGISKTPVREALQILVNDGLITVIQRKGYVVSQLGIKDVREILEVRLAIETGIAEAAAKQATEQDIEELRNLLEIQMSGTGVAVLTSAAREFHIRVADIARNSRAKKILMPLYDETTRIHHLVPLTAQHLDSDEETRGHELLLDAIANHDPEAAGRVMREHINVVRATTMRGLMGA